jgi:hypothetical protein
MRSILFAAVASAVLACAPSTPPASTTSVSSGTAPTVTALQRLFRATQAEASWFAPSFLVEDPIERVQDLLDVVHLTMGDFQGVLGNGQDYVVRFSAGQKSVRAKVDEDGRFVMLLVGPG